MGAKLDVFDHCQGPDSDGDCRYRGVFQNKDQAYLGFCEPCGVEFRLLLNRERR